MPDLRDCPYADITERKAAGLAVKENMTKFRTLFEKNPEAIFITDFVEILCGTFSLESTPGKGLVFTLELPVYCQKRQQKKSPDILSSSEA